MNAKQKSIALPVACDEDGIIIITTTTLHAPITKQVE
jgi:hypothetical protein